MSFICDGLQAAVEDIKEEIEAVEVVDVVAAEVGGMVIGVAPILGTLLLVWILNSN